MSALVTQLVQFVLIFHFTCRDINIKCVIYRESESGLSFVWTKIKVDGVVSFGNSCCFRDLHARCFCLYKSGTYTEMSNCLCLCLSANECSYHIVLVVNSLTLIELNT